MPKLAASFLTVTLFTLGTRALDPTDLLTCNFKYTWCHLYHDNNWLIGGDGPSMFFTYVDTNCVTASLTTPTFNISHPICFSFEYHFIPSDPHLISLTVSGGNRVLWQTGSNVTQPTWATANVTVPADREQFVTIVATKSVELDQVKLAKFRAVEGEC